LAKFGVSVTLHIHDNSFFVEFLAKRCTGSRAPFFSPLYAFVWVAHFSAAHLCPLYRVTAGYFGWMGRCAIGNALQLGDTAVRVLPLISLCVSPVLRQAQTLWAPFLHDSWSIWVPCLWLFAWKHEHSCVFCNIQLRASPPLLLQIAVLLQRSLTLCCCAVACCCALHLR
jgi:hypothetical protein